MQPTQPTPPSAGYPAARTAEEKFLAVICHLSYVVLVFPVLIPLAVWLIKGNESRYVAFHAMQSLLAHLSMTVAFLVGGPLVILLIGISILIVAGIAWLVLWVMELIAAIVTFQGQDFRLPLVADWADDIVQ